MPSHPTMQRLCCELVGSPFVSRSGLEWSLCSRQYSTRSHYYSSPFKRACRVASKVGPLSLQRKTSRPRRSSAQLHTSRDEPQQAQAAAGSGAWPRALQVQRARQADAAGAPAPPPADSDASAHLLALVPAQPKARRLRRSSQERFEEVQAEKAAQHCKRQAREAARTLKPARAPKAAARCCGASATDAGASAPAPALVSSQQQSPQQSPPQ